MNVTELEGFILDGLGRTVRAQQLAGPSLRVCVPKIVEPEDRADLVRARALLDEASLQARAAKDLFTQASGMISEFLEEPHA